MQRRCYKQDESRIRTSTRNLPGDTQCLHQTNTHHSSGVPSSIVRASFITAEDSGTSHAISLASIQNSKHASNTGLSQSSTSSNPSKFDLISGRLNDFVKKFRSKIDKNTSVTDISNAKGVNENAEEGMKVFFFFVIQIINLFYSDKRFALPCRQSKLL